MAFRWAAALCESMKPKSARLAGPVVVGAAAVVVGVVADTVVVAVETAVAVVVVVAVVRAAGNRLEALSPLK